MSIITVRTFVRRVARPLLVFWLFSQSMLLCAAGLSEHGHNTGLAHSMDRMVASDHSMHAIDHVSMGHDVPSQDTADLSMLSSSSSGGALADCCDVQDAAASMSVVNLLLMLLTVLFLAPLYWLLPMLSASIRYRAYWRKTSLRYNYPTYPILHCSLLN